MKLILSLFMLMLPVLSFAQNPSDYLIMQDIGQYKFMGKGGGQGSGIVSATGHFNKDHLDESYGGMYFHESHEIGVNVEITQHSGSESDKWLLHEIEHGYRDSDDSDGRLGLLSGAGVKIREIGGSKFFYWGLGGGSYSWISGSKVVEIKYTDLQRTKPETIEVVQAYLAKHPSTITLTDTELKSSAQNERWIKDEMDRMLWLCDKWVERKQAGAVDVNKLLNEMHDHMEVFLDYKKKYYGIDTDADKKAIYGYMQNKDEASMKNKLTEYTAWWTANKDRAIRLP